MVNSFIGCGNLSTLHINILYIIIFKFLKEILLTLNTFDENINYNIFKTEIELNKHVLIKSLYKYLSFMIFGKIFLYFSKKNNKFNITEKTITNELIYNNPNNSFNSLKDLIIVCLIYVFFLEFIQISYSLGLKDFDLWIFNIVFTLFFLSYYFSKKIYHHQKYSLLFIFITNLILLVLLTIYPEDNNAYDQVSNLFKYKIYSLFIFLIYILNSFLISFSRVLGKRLMDLKNVSPYSIIILIGIFGFILTSILITLASFYKCTKEDICNIYDINKQEDNSSKYYDNIYLYFSNLKYKSKKKKVEFWIEVTIVSPLNLLINFMEFNYEILLIFFLNPIYVLISESLYYGIIELLVIILNRNLKKNKKSILTILADLFSFIGYLIYVEIIELKFCELNKNIRKAIIERGKRETIGSFDIGKDDEIYEEEINEEKEDNLELSFNEPNNQNYY